MRPVNCRPEEMWSYDYADDPAPAGVAFDVTVPSASRPERGYRVIRDEVSRVIIHHPRCEAWEHGHLRCRHVARALAVAEDPLRTFALDVLEAWGAGGSRPAEREEFGAAVYRSAVAAVHQMDVLDTYEARRREPAPTSADAVESFG